MPTTANEEKADGPSRVRLIHRRPDRYEETEGERQVRREGDRARERRRRDERTDYDDNDEPSDRDDVTRDS
jgi:hypothetical protein